MYDVLFENSRAVRRGKADWTNREACLPRRDEGAVGRARINACVLTTLVTTNHCIPIPPTRGLI